MTDRQPSLRRIALACAAALSLASPLAYPAADSGSEREAAYRSTLARGQQALAEGRGAEAVTLLEQAANTFGERPEAEVALIRAYLRAGDMRHAVAWSSLVAGENPDLYEAHALRAFILDRSGYTPLAIEQLTQAQAAHPDDPALLAALAEIRLDRGEPDRALALLAQFIAGHPPTPELQTLQARAAAATAPHHPLANGVVMDGGRHVLTMLDAVADRTRIEVRNSIGGRSQARIERADESSGLALLSLDTPFAAEGSFAMDALADASAGTASFVGGFAVADARFQSYPLLNPGLTFRRVPGRVELLQTTSWIGPDERGAAVLDLSGHLIGLAAGSGARVQAGAGLERGQFVLPARLLRRLLTGSQQPASGTTASPAASRTELSRDELYERVLSAVVLISAQ